MPMNQRPSSPAARISSSGGGSFFSMVSLTRFQYGLSSTVNPWLPHQTTSPLLMTKLARPALTSRTISRATQSPPCSRNIVRCTPGRSFTSSTDASVTQPLSTVSVITSVLVMNGMTTWISSLVSGSKIIFTSLFTTSSDPLWHDEPEHFDEEFHQIRLARVLGQVHHRPRVADRGEGEAALRRSGLSPRRTREKRRRQCRKRGQGRKQSAAVDAG